MQRNLLLLLLIVLSNFSFAYDLKINLDKKERDIEIYVIKYGDRELVDSFYGVSDTTLNVSLLDDRSMAYVRFGKYDYAPIYLKGNKTVTLVIRDNDYAIKSINYQNKQLKRWWTISTPLRKLTYLHGATSSNVVADIGNYEKELVSLMAEKDKFVTKLKGKDQYFDDAMKQFCEIDLEYMRLFYMNCPLVSVKFRERDLADLLYTDIYAEKKYDDESILDFYPYAMYSIYYYPSYALSKMEKPQPTLKIIESDRVREAFLLFSLVKNCDSKRYRHLMGQYGCYITDKEIQERVEKARHAIVKVEEGEQGFNFKLPNQNDEQITFSQYRGKVVVIDFWATWCAPCCKVKPDFKKLAEKMKGMDVEFVTLSIDSNVKKWRNYIKDSTMTELIDKEGVVAKYYAISGVPTFIIFDKEGKIFKLDAAYPTRGLEEQILKALEL